MADPAYYVNGTDLTTVKLNLNLVSISKYDSNIAEWGLEGNREIDDLLAKHTATLPLTGDQFTSAKYAVFEYIAVEFYTYTKDWEAVARSQIQYDDARNALIEKIDSDITQNTGASGFSLGNDYRSTELFYRTFPL